MNFDDRLTEIFDRGLRSGVDALTPLDRDLYRIQDFILEFEMNGLSGYFYNRLPNLSEITATVLAMRKHGLLELASQVGEAAELFVRYSDPDPPTTWDETLRQYDPSNRLRVLQTRVEAIENYGLNKASIGDAGDANC